MEKRIELPKFWPKIKAKTERKKYKIEDIFEQFKSRYGSKPAKPVPKPQKPKYFKRSPEDMKKFNSTQFSYMKDITEIKYKIDLMKGQSNAVSQNWGTIPPTEQINWQLLRDMEEMVNSWMP